MTAPTKQPLPGTKPDPYADVERAAVRLVERARADVADQDPLDRYGSIVWWQQVHQRAAELLHTTVRGEPLAELAEQHTYRQIETMLAGEGTPVSDSTITKLIRAWKQWRSAALPG